MPEYDDHASSMHSLSGTQTSWLDGKHVVFGQVLSGYEVVKAVEMCGSRSGATSVDIIVSDCGEVTKAAGGAGGGAGK